ncbi:MAG: YbaK/EbsC family protein [Chloroflexi bacterium]|nr:YbaK/EbsC family protein [Chloroflexota bacterium]MCL5109158.1 YbaK/EbsC family protein [Chloroflexota bacterium]
MDCLTKLEAFLRDNKVPFQVQHHPVAYTAQELAASEHIPGRLVAKSVVAFVDGRMVMLVLPGPRKVDFAKAEALFAAKEVRLAREAEFAATFPDCDVGAMPPFGNMYGLPVYVDKSLAADDKIVFPAGTHTDTISMRYADFANLAQPTVVDFGHGVP